MAGQSKKKKQGPEKPDRSTIVPRIKHLQFLKVFDEMDIPDGQIPYTEPLVADLLVAYAFDMPGIFQMVTHDDLKELGIGPGELREIALANLKQQMPKIGVADADSFFRIVTGEDLEACVLLASKFWDNTAAKTEGTVVAVVPSRDVLLYCSSESAAGLEFIRALAKEITDTGDTHTLSKHLITWSNGKWAKYDGKARKSAKE
jgi:uncharacterized protein YtpQ (UPF0354 family)